MKCFYVPGSTSIIDTIADNGLSSICKETLEQIKQRYPGSEIWDLDEAFNEIEKLSYERYISAPKEVNIDRWWEMLEILPPMKWRNDGNTESFMVCETLTLDLHSIFCRIGDRYFEMVNRRSMTHQEIVAACSNF